MLGVRRSPVFAGVCSGGGCGDPALVPSPSSGRPAAHVPICPCTLSGGGRSLCLGSGSQLSPPGPALVVPPSRSLAFRSHRALAPAPPPGILLPPQVQVLPRSEFPTPPFKAWLLREHWPVPFSFPRLPLTPLSTANSLALSLGQAVRG